jgi:hypothetical protein
MRVVFRVCEFRDWIPSPGPLKMRGYLGEWEEIVSRTHAPRPFGAITGMRQGCDGDATECNCDIGFFVAFKMAVAI